MRAQTGHGKRNASTADKKMLNFIASESKFGFFKYERFLKDVKVGDILGVRFQGGSQEGMHQVYTAIKINDEEMCIHLSDIGLNAMLVKYFEGYKK